MLLAAGALIGLNHTSFAQAIAVVLAACSIADLSWYTLGRRRGNSVLRLLCRISLEPDSCVSTTEDWFRRLGVWSLVIAKFVPGLGALAAPMAGLSRMPILRFLWADYLGVMLWSAAYLGIGYVFRAQLEDAGIFIGRLGGSLFALIFLLISLWIGWKVWNRKRLLHRLRIARVTPEEVAERLSEFVILDLRSLAELEQEGLGLPGAIWFDRHDLGARHLEIPRDRDILLYCS
jgi:membrane protein DedA with SNARE-associated domain